MLLQRKITLYRDVRDRIGKPATFADFLQACLESRPAVETLRATIDADERRKLKTALPCATISGLFAPTRKTENLVQHSSLLCLDFDHVTDCAGLMEKLAHLDCVAYASRSCSGRGVFAAVPVVFPDRHKEHFAALCHFFGDWGYELDKQCGDVTRLRVVSYDPDAVLRLNAVPFEGLWREPRQAFQCYKRDFADDTIVRVQMYVDKIIERAIDITEVYEDWVRVALALSTLGEVGRQFFHAVSSQNAKYDTYLCDKKFNECRGARRIGIGTFFEICHQHGLFPALRRC